MTMFPFSINAIESIATLHSATPQAKSDRDATPILRAISLTVTPADWTAVATDRYIVGELTAPLGDVAHTVDGSVTILLDSTEWRDLAKRAKAAAGRLTFTQRDVARFQFVIGDDGNVTISDSFTGLTIGHYAQMSGNFPPVARLFPADPNYSTDAIALDAGMIARLAKILPPALVGAKPADRNFAGLVIRFTESSTAKPGPALVHKKAAYGSEPVAGFRGIIQPLNM